MYEFAVVGKGMLGAPAARHLAKLGKKTLLIGSDEPKNYLDHDGVYASHYDEGRICRIIDPDPIRAELAYLSIPAHKALQQSTGIDFFVECGHLAVGPIAGVGSDYIESLLPANDKYELGCRQLSSSAVKKKYPYFQPGDEFCAILQETNAGYINPRSYIGAESAECESHGGDVVSDLVFEVRKQSSYLEIVTAGTTYRAEKVLLATGAFSAFGRMSPRPIELRVGSHTVLLVELSKDAALALQDMPSIIFKPADAEKHCFVLPPIKYPDGQVYLKISHPSPTHYFDDIAAVQAWFKTQGDDRIREQLLQRVGELFPALPTRSFKSMPCVTSFTPKSHPYIDSVSKSLFLLLGGNAYVAKCSIALGEIAAAFAIDGSWIHDQLDRDAFRL